MQHAPKFNPAADLAAKLIEQIEVGALDFQMDTRTLGAMVVQRLSMWFEALPREAASRKKRLPSPTRPRNR